MKKEVKLYYTPPKEELFSEVKEKAIEVWRGYDDGYGYATGKIDRIKNIQNIEDNFMYMVAMFDIYNQGKLAEKLSDEARKAIRERMIDGGNPPENIKF